MWNKIRAFIKREYSGYRVDIAALIPAEPIIVTAGQNQFTLGGQVTLSLETQWNLASFSSTLMHEIKHAIDQNSHAAVEGAAWEGARATWITQGGQAAHNLKVCLALVSIEAAFTSESLRLIPWEEIL
jgi:hypothetical protein